ncbi:urease subunit alpha, partial [Helicobacter pylori]
AFDAGIGEQLKLNKPVVAVKNMRNLRKRDMIHNGATPKMEVDSETYEVRADGELLVCEPAVSLPLAQRYFLF